VAQIEVQKKLPSSSNYSSRAARPKQNLLIYPAYLSRVHTTILEVAYAFLDHSLFVVLVAIGIRTQGVPVRIRTEFPPFS
jgi:hypothetical protein